MFAFTRLNAHSSRSHAIVMLTIIKRRRTAPGQEEGPLQKVKIGKLFMVDLAGSERLKKSLSTGTLSLLSSSLQHASFTCFDWLMRLIAVPMYPSVWQQLAVFKTWTIYDTVEQP